MPPSWSAAELEWPFAGAGLRCRDVVAPIDERERLQLCDLLQELAPDAPTLCAGWTTSDMAAHLVLREHFRRWGDEPGLPKKPRVIPTSSRAAGWAAGAVARPRRAHAG